VVLLPIGIALAAFVARNPCELLRLDTDGLSGEFGRVEQAADGKYADCYDALGSRPRDEAVGGLGGGLYYAPGPFRTGSRRTFAAGVNSSLTAF
jgi:hypothetical protein